MIDWAEVTPIIVTRGDVDLMPIIETLPFWHVVIWNNGDGSREDLAVYGRYAAIEEASQPVIFVCDDDVILEPDSYDQLLAAYQPGHVVCNMPERFRHDFYEDHALVGFGAIFDRDLPGSAFYRLHTANSANPDHYSMPGRKRFLRTCDIVFTALTPRILLDLPYTEREFASAPNRMWKQPEHVGERARMLELARKARNA